MSARMCAPLCGRRDDFSPALRFWTAVYSPPRLNALTLEIIRRHRLEIHRDFAASLKEQAYSGEDASLTSSPRSGD